MNHMSGAHRNRKEPCSEKKTVSGETVSERKREGMVI